jgi:amidase
MSSSEPPELHFTSARELAALLRARQISAREVMQAHLDRIARLNPRLNAIVSKLPDEACLALADEADRQLARGQASGPLHGLPIAYKDNQPVKGFPWTRGSRIFARDVPVGESVFVSRVRAAGALAIGKTNIPEFAMGSHTYNALFGRTLNAYDPTKSAGGSSGGAAVALATGMLPIADGNDLGGSLRNPANFNNLVALRPTVGLVPTAPDPFPGIGFNVNGPLARSVSDVAFLMRVMAGPDPRDPHCLVSDPSVFTRPLERDFQGTRVAWCLDLGALPVDPRVRKVIEHQRRTFEKLGCIVEEGCPDLSAADEVFLTIRAWRAAGVLGPLLAEHRELMKPEAVAEIERGLTINRDEVERALSRHRDLVDGFRRFQESFPFTVCVVNQVPPFDVDLDWPKTIDGVAMRSYTDWMKSAYWISTTLCPAISVPAGFTDDGLPVGLQIVGRYKDDVGVLQLAYAFEQATRFGERRPPSSSARSST